MSITSVSGLVSTSVSSVPTSNVPTKAPQGYSGAALDKAFVQFSQYGGSKYIDDCGTPPHPGRIPIPHPGPGPVYAPTVYGQIR
jgi:hypothetical protein